jgi:hypothetical protein
LKIPPEERNLLTNENALFPFQAEPGQTGLYFGFKLPPTWGDLVTLAPLPNTGQQIPAADLRGLIL